MSTSDLQSRGNGRDRDASLLAPGPLLTGLLGELFEDLHDHKIPYCVLRDGHRLRDVDSLGGELDFLVPIEALNPLRIVLRRLGFAELPSLGHTPHHFFLAYSEVGDHWIKLDVVHALAYGSPTRALRTRLGERCIANRVYRDPAFFPSVEDELISLLLHCVLDRRDFRRDHRERIRALCAEVTDASALADTLSECWSPTTNWLRLESLVSEDAWEELLADAPGVIEVLVRGDRFGTTLRRIGNRFLKAVNRRTGGLQRRPLSVALLAPDGAGKSTLTASLEKRLPVPVHRVYMGLYARPTDLPLPFLPRSLSVLLRQWGRYLRARFHQMRGFLVLFDRYSYDALLPAVPGASRYSIVRRWLLGHAVPHPDLVLILDAPGEVLFQRKGERDVESLEAQRGHYRAFRERLPRSAIVDATQDADTVRRQATALLWRTWVNRGV